MHRWITALALTVPALAAAQPSPAPAPKPPAVHDVVPLDGPVAGLPGYKITLTKSPTHCGGKKLVVTRPRKRPTTDAPLAAVFDLQFPTGLNFDPDPKKKTQKEKSLQRFNDFVTEMMKVGRAANDHYAAQIAATKDAETSFAAAARILQMQVHTARMLVYAELPKDVRTGELADEKVAAFCDKLVEVAEPIDEKAREALEKCKPGVAQFPSAWWAPVCRTP